MDAEMLSQRGRAQARILSLCRVAPCDTLIGTARQRRLQDAQKFPGHRWSGLLRKTLSQQTVRNQRSSKG